MGGAGRQHSGRSVSNQQPPNLVALDGNCCLALSCLPHGLPWRLGSAERFSGLGCAESCACGCWLAVGLRTWLAEAMSCTVTYLSPASPSSWLRQKQGLEREDVGKASPGSHAVLSATFCWPPPKGRS